MQRPARPRRDPGEGGAGRQAGGPLAGRASRPHGVRVLRHASVKSEFLAAAVKCKYCEVAGGVGRGGGGAAPPANPGHPRYPGQRQGGNPGLRRALQVSQLSSPLHSQPAICVCAGCLAATPERRDWSLPSSISKRRCCSACSLFHIYWPFIWCFTRAGPFL